MMIMMTMAHINLFISKTPCYLYMQQLNWKRFKITVYKNRRKKQNYFNQRNAKKYQLINEKINQQTKKQENQNSTKSNNQSSHHTTSIVNIFFFFFIIAQ